MEFLSRKRKRHGGIVLIGNGSVLLNRNFVTVHYVGAPEAFAP